MNFIKTKGIVSAKMVETIDALGKVNPERLSIKEIEEILSLCGHFSEGVSKKVFALQQIIAKRKNQRPQLQLMQR